MHAQLLFATQRNRDALWRSVVCVFAGVGDSSLCIVPCQSLPDTSRTCQRHAVGTQFTGGAPDQAIETGRQGLRPGLQARDRSTRSEGRVFLLSRCFVLPHFWTDVTNPALLVASLCMMFTRLLVGHSGDRGACCTCRTLRYLNTKLIGHMVTSRFEARSFRCGRGTHVQLRLYKR